MAGTDALQYEPLSANGNRQLRLLVLRPSLDRESSLIASFTYTSLTSNITSYEAISYAWGSDVCDHVIRSPSGSSLPITASAAAALRAVRLQSNHRLIWIDGLCINQKDQREKAQQVAIMGRIYGAATRTLVYLGEDDDDHFSYLVHALASARSTLPAATDDDDDPPFGYDADGEVIRQPPILTGRDRVGIDPRTATLDHVAAVAYHAREISYGGQDAFPPLLEFRTWFFARPWFTRLWMMQEIAMSRRIRFYFAGQELSWGTVMAFHNLVDWQSQQMIHDFYGHPLVSDRSILGTRIVMNFENDDTIGPGGIEFAGEWLYLRHRTNIIDFPEEYYSQGRHPLILRRHLMDLLCEMRHFHCKDPRDRLYALLSLFQDTQSGIPSLLNPDYRPENTVAIVYSGITQYLVHHGYLDVLAAAQGLPKRSFDLPTWAVDWTQPPDRTELLTGTNIQPENLRIGLPPANIDPAKTSASLLASSLASQGRDVLILRGVALGELTYVSAFPYIPSSSRGIAFRNADDRNFLQIYSCWMWWKKYAHSLSELGIDSTQLPSPQSLPDSECWDKDTILESEPLLLLPDFAQRGIQHWCRNRTFAVVGDVGISLLNDRDGVPLRPVPVPGSGRLHRLPKQLRDEDWEDGWVPTRANCLVPPAAEIGDLVCGILGSAVAVVLRRRRNQDGFQLVGMTTYWKSSISKTIPDLNWNEALTARNVPRPLQEFRVY